MPIQPLPLSQPCAERVYLPTSDARLIALDAADGKVCTSFADQGVLHLETGMRYNPAKLLLFHLAAGRGGGQDHRRWGGERQLFD